MHQSEPLRFMVAPQLCAWVLPHVHRLPPCVASDVCETLKKQATGATAELPTFTLRIHGCTAEVMVIFTVMSQNKSSDVS
jgi:hypothetical protein